MSGIELRGTGVLSLCVAVFTVVSLSSCHGAKRQTKAKHDLEEIHADINAVKNNPSYTPGSNQAGPPLHLDPYPHSAAMSHHADGPGKPHH
jgi:hypothetical protein